MDKKMLEALDKARNETRRAYTKEEIAIVQEALKAGYTGVEITKAGIIKGHGKSGIRNFVERVKAGMK
jgi:D-aminopeptidase